MAMDVPDSLDALHDHYCDAGYNMTLSVNSLIAVTTSMTDDQLSENVDEAVSYINDMAAALDEANTEMERIGAEMEDL